MKFKTNYTYQKPGRWVLASLLCLASLQSIPVLVKTLSPDMKWDLHSVPTAKELRHEIKKMGFEKKLNQRDMAAYIDYRQKTGKSLAQTLNDPYWTQKFGLKNEEFKATWYMSNPFDLLPHELKGAIQSKKIPFRSRTHVWQWCRINNIPNKFRKALYAALIETTPINLWRASRGQRPFAKNGQFLEPIVIDHGNGEFEVRDGHIATDPQFIPTNSHVLLLVRIQGEDRVLRVKATDVGAAIKGRHVDLPIQVGPHVKPLPDTRLPKKHIRNRTVRILRPLT